MGYMTNGLAFNVLRDANQRRLPDFGSDCLAWSPRDWMLAMVGEVGEASNTLKKVSRGDFELAEVREQLADELADIQTYLDLLANSLDIDLGRATIRKFNVVSKRVDSSIRLRQDGADWCYEGKGIQ